MSEVSLSLLLFISSVLSGDPSEAHDQEEDNNSHDYEYVRKAPSHKYHAQDHMDEALYKRVFTIETEFFFDTIANQAKNYEDVVRNCLDPEAKSCYAVDTQEVGNKKICIEHRVPSCEGRSTDIDVLAHAERLPDQA